MDIRAGGLNVRRLVPVGELPNEANKTFVFNDTLELGREKKHCEELAGLVGWPLNSGLGRYSNSDLECRERK